MEWIDLKKTFNKYIKINIKIKEQAYNILSSVNALCSCTLFLNMYIMQKIIVYNSTKRNYVVNVTDRSWGKNLFRYTSHFINNKYLNNYFIF